MNKQKVGGMSNINNQHLVKRRRNIRMHPHSFNIPRNLVAMETIALLRSASSIIPEMAATQPLVNNRQSPTRLALLALAPQVQSYVGSMVGARTRSAHTHTPSPVVRHPMLVTA
jgi:hypothetical protein